MTGLERSMLVVVGTKDCQAPWERAAVDWGLQTVYLGLKTDTFHAAAHIKRAGFVAIWNGFQNSTTAIAEICRRRGIAHCFWEQGMLEQRQHYAVDPMGFCGDSSLCGPLSWVTREDIEALHEKRAELQAAHPIGDDGYVLIPMQVFNDTQVLFHSPFETMHQFVEAVERVFPGRELVFRPHPRGANEYTPTVGRVESQGSFLEHAARAHAVVGINSTCLMEAVVLGKPVLALGGSPLRSHPPHAHDIVAAAALALNFPRCRGNPAPILARLGCKPSLIGRPHA